jgi:AraC-like DNA-binding protein
MARSEKLILRHSPRISSHPNPPQKPIRSTSAAPAAAHSSFHYLRVPESAILWGAYVTGAGQSSIPATVEYPPIGHPALYNFNWTRGRTLPEFALVIVTEGRGNFESHESGAIDIPPNSVTLLFPGVWHRYKPDPRTGWVERWLTFNGELVHRLVEHHGVSPSNPVLPLGNIAAVLRAFDRFYSGIAKAPTTQSIVLSLRAMAILSLAAEHVRPSRKQRAASITQPQVEDDLVAATIDMIWTQSHRPLSVEQIADELGVSRRTIERRMRIAVGRSVLEEIQACRLSRAKRLLRETDLAVKTVAYLSGFGSVERLRLGMLKSEKCAPGDFRRVSRRDA